MVNQLKERKRPCLCVSCKCGKKVFAAGILEKDMPHDPEWINEIAEYAKQGYPITVKDASEFKLEHCECMDKKE